MDNEIDKLPPFQSAEAFEKLDHVLGKDQLSVLKAIKKEEK